MEWQPVETIPYGGTVIQIKAKSPYGGSDVVFRYCTYIAPTDTDENGNDYYCYDDMDWFSDPELYDPESGVASDWVSWEILAWRPEAVVRCFA